MCTECAFHQVHDGTVEKDGGLAPEPHGWADALATNDLSTPPKEEA